MSTSIISSLVNAGQQMNIYGGIITLITGVLGGILNIIVFVSLKTFQESSCAFYLLIMSFFNIGQLLTGLLSRTLLYIYGTDGTDSSLFYCKFRLHCSHICVMISLTCFCLSTIDQYCATSSYQRLQKFSNIKIARYLVIIFSFIWILHGIPYSVLSYHSVSINTGKVSCVMTNTIYIQYRTYFIVLILLGFLPFSITVLFGLLSYRNVRKLSHYAVPLVRRELDKQLTTMVLVQVVVNFFTLLPYALTNVLSLHTKYSNDSLLKAKVDLSSNITLTLYYVYYSNSFYVYICASERFRRQLSYVLCKIRMNRFKRQARVTSNQIQPIP